MDTNTERIKKIKEILLEGDIRHILIATDKDKIYNSSEASADDIYTMFSIEAMDHPGLYYAIAKAINVGLLAALHMKKELQTKEGKEKLLSLIKSNDELKIPNKE